MSSVNEILFEWDITTDGQVRCHVSNFQKDANIVARSIGRANAHDINLGSIKLKPGQMGVVDETGAGVVLAFGAEVAEWQMADLRWLNFPLDNENNVPQDT